MNTKRVNSAAGVILAALQQNRTPAGIALALESAGLLMTPEAAADLAQVSAEAVALSEKAVAELKREHAENARLRERIAELEAAKERAAAHTEHLAKTLVARTEDLIAVESEQGFALPWAHAMSDGDLHLFLDDLVGAAMNRWRTEPDGTSVPDRETLALVEEACARWRTPGEGNRLDGSGLDGIVRLIAPTQALQVPEPGACEKCTDGPADWCPGCSTCRCETHNPGCVQAGNPR